MIVYTKKIIVKSEHLDWNNHVNNLIYLQWAVEISREHWLSKVSEEIANNYFWLVRSHHIEYKKQAFLDEQLIVKTYVKSVNGPLSERIVEIWRGEILVAKVNSNWCFLNSKTQKLERVPEEVMILFT